MYGIDINQRSTLRAFRQSIWTNTLEDAQVRDGWSLNWLGNYTRSKDDRSEIGEARWDSPSTRTSRPTVVYDFTNPLFNTPKLFTTVQLASPTRYQAGTPVTAIDTFAKPLSSLRVLDAVDTTDAYTARLVVARDLPLLGGEATIKLGFQFDQRTKTVDESQILLNAAAQYNSVGMPTVYNQFSLDRPFLGKIPMGYTFRYFDTAKMRQVSEAARQNFAFTPNTGNIYDVREQVFAGFAMGTVRYDWGSILGGVRVEHLKNRGIAEATVAGVTGPVTAEASQTLAFLSLHLNYNIDDTKKFRLSFNSGAARRLRPAAPQCHDQRCQPDDFGRGNPSVKPERAYGVDAYLEWYVRPQGYLMVGAFTKRSTMCCTRSGALWIGCFQRRRHRPSGYAFSGITNGGDGRIFGLEAAAQLQLEPWTGSLGMPEWMGGFGISANVTVNDSQVTKPAIGTVPARKVRLPGTSDLVYNAGVYYEKYGLSLRLQYQRRSKWLDGIADDLTDAGDTYWAADDEMDFSARYAINRNVELYFDASNLLNKPGRRFSDPGNLLRASGVPSPDLGIYTIEYERFGRRYTAYWVTF